MQGPSSRAYYGVRSREPRVAVTLSIVFLALFSTYSFAASPELISTTAVSRAKQSIIPIVCASNKDNRFKVEKVIGSGFFVDADGRFVTAGHVIEGAEAEAKKGECFAAIYFPELGWENHGKELKVLWYRFGSCERDEKLDLAVCQSTENPLRSEEAVRAHISVATFERNAQDDGTQVAFTGFPLGLVVPLTSTGVVAGTIDNKAGGYMYVVNQTVWPGASGSLLYNPNGKVIGVLLSRGIENAIGTAFVQSSAAVLDFLRKHPLNAKKDKNAEIKTLDGSRE